MKLWAYMDTVTLSAFGGPEPSGLYKGAPCRHSLVDKALDHDLADTISAAVEDRSSSLESEVPSYLGNSDPSDRTTLRVTLLNEHRRSVGILHEGEEVRVRDERLVSVSEADIEALVRCTKNFERKTIEFHGLD